MHYSIKTKRLGLRNWHVRDLDNLLEMNSDPEVMRYFPSTQDRNSCRDFIERMNTTFTNLGYCYFAVELKSEKKFIGFVGLASQDYGEAGGQFTDIGWRLMKPYWNKGFAKEAASACLDYGFNVIGLKEIKAVAPKVNLPSIALMKRLGMQLEKEIIHPKLDTESILNPCVMYSKTSPG